MADGIYLSAVERVSALADDDTLVVTWKDTADANKVKTRRINKSVLAALIAASILVPAASDATPADPSASGAAGISAAFSRADHSHRRDSTKADVTALTAATAAISGWTSLKADFLAGLHSFTANAGGGSVNGFQLYGSLTGAPVRLSAVGTDANIILSLVSKGTGSVELRAGDVRTFVASYLALGVNFINVQSAVTGTKAVITATGSDANVSGVFKALGSGGGWEFATPLMLRAYTVATLPDAATFNNHTIRIADRSHRLATSNGTNWLFTGDGSVVS